MFGKIEISGKSQKMTKMQNNSKIDFLYKHVPITAKLREEKSNMNTVI